MIWRGIVACMLALLSPAAALAGDPRVPAAKDAAGTPVAVVGAGIDYTDPVLTSRLARDGEGNIIGWDFVDNDIFPFSKDVASNALAKALVANPAVKLVPVRVPGGDDRAVAGAAAFVARTPARIVVVLTPGGGNKEDWDLFAKAAQHFAQLLFVVPAGDGTAPQFPAALALANVLSVAAPAGKDETANVAFAPPEAATAGNGNAEAAIALAAALVTCHATAIGDGDGQARKEAVLTKLARPRSVSKVPAIENCP